MSVNSQGIKLNVIEHGNPCATRTLLVLHGLRDNVRALLPALDKLLECQPELRLLLLEFRGHGNSEHAQTYAMSDFVLDVYNVQQALIEGQFALFGHSLGGHIAARFSALFPEQVAATMLVEGLGPPRRPHEHNPTQALATYREMLLTQIAPRTTRPMESIDAAVTKLLRNNPRLDPQHARTLAPHLTRAQDEHLVWSFDVRASSAFLGATSAENENYWRHVTAPTLIVSGALAHEYWQREMATDGYDGLFADGELAARVACFQRGEHHWFERSGHMVHYDEPDRLGHLCAKFLEKNYE